nr:cycloartenol-C-24-methyltransferase 1-like [Ipomoea batatas]
MKMPFPDNSFDAVFALQATCHAPDIVGCYKEIYRVLKPGQCFVADEWCLTDSYNPDSSEHQKIKSELELGNSLPEIRLTSQCLDAAKKAGFEVQALECVGIAPKGSRRVYDFLQKSRGALVAGAKKGIFTPMYFFVVRKPVSASE